MASLLDLNSDASDSEDDCDYVPPAGELSENSDNEVSDDEIEESTNRKRKTKPKNDDETPDDRENEDDGKKELTAEDEKKRSDELWQSFMKDVQPVTKKSNGESSSNGAKDAAVPSTEAQPSKVTVTEVYEFAGEEVTVTKEVDAASAPPQTSVNSSNKSSNSIPGGFPKRLAKGLSSVMGTLSKKQKLSTLDKTMLDWKKFKQDEGIEEELKHHTEGKGGYLEKQAFLQRSDVRQFEIEKSLRLSKRTNL